MFKKKLFREITYILFAFLGATITFLNTWNYGNGLTDDSINYIFSGTNLYLLNGLYNYDGSVFISWPPFYSLIIFVIWLVGSDIYSSIIIFNAILYMLTIFLLGRLSEITFKTPIIKILYTGTLTFSFQLLFIYTKVLSETIFITLTIFVILLYQYKKTNANKGFIVILLTICILTRYLGIVLVITYSLLILYLDKDSAPKRKHTSIINILYHILPILPICLWFARCWYLTSKISSLKFNSAETIYENLYKLFYVTSSLFIPESLNANFRIGIFLLLLLIIIAYYFKLNIKPKNNIVYVWFSFLYILILLILSSTLKFDDISYRFIMPLYFIFLIYIFYFFEYIINYSKNKSKHVMKWIILILIISFPIEKGIKHTFINYSNGIVDFHSKKWKESRTIIYIKTNLIYFNIYSNSAAGIYANTGLQTNRISNYLKNDSGNKKTAQIIFNNSLPGIDTIPNLISSLSISDSIIYFDDSYIILRKNL